ncbi:MAG: hypothetical protein AAFR27_10580 [Pseudomonadota bacterium]
MNLLLVSLAAIVCLLLTAVSIIWLGVNVIGGGPHGRSTGWVRLALVIAVIGFGTAAFFLKRSELLSAAPVVL